MLFGGIDYTWRVIHTFLTPAVFHMHELLRVQRFRTCSALPNVLVSIGATAMEVMSVTSSGLIKCSHYVSLFRYCFIYFLLMLLQTDIGSFNFIYFKNNVRVRWEISW